MLSIRNLYKIFYINSNLIICRAQYLFAKGLQFTICVLQWNCLINCIRRIVHNYLRDKDFVCTIIQRVRGSHVSTFPYPRRQHCRDVFQLKLCYCGSPYSCTLLPTTYDTTLAHLVHCYIIVDMFAISWVLLCIFESLSRQNGLCFCQIMSQPGSNYV